MDMGLQGEEQKPRNQWRPWDQRAQRKQGTADLRRRTGQPALAQRAPFEEFYKAGP